MRQCFVTRVLVPLGWGRLGQWSTRNPYLRDTIARQRLVHLLEFSQRVRRTGSQMSPKNCRRNSLSMRGLVVRLRVAAVWAGGLFAESKNHLPRLAAKVACAASHASLGLVRPIVVADGVRCQPCRVAARAIFSLLPETRRCVQCAPRTGAC